MKGHWSRACCTPKHLVDLYQVSIKEKGKEIEMNPTDKNGVDLTYYDTDFFEGPTENTNYVFYDENTATELYFLYKKLNKMPFLLLHLFIISIAFILIVSKIHVKMNEGDICIADYATTRNYSR